MLLDVPIERGAWLDQHKSKGESKLETIAVGLDTETYEGEPITVQIHCDEQPSLTTVLWVDGENVTKKFLQYLERKCKRNVHYRMYVHHLPFDMVSLFYPIWQRLAEGELDFDMWGWSIRGLYGAPSFLRMISHTGNQRVDIVDSLLWFQQSLDGAAQQFCPDLPKLERMQGLGTTRFTKKDKLFVEYAERDAQVSCRLGQIIEDMHRDLSIAPTISLASMAAQVFRTHYIDCPIQQPPGEIMKPALYSYHGGRNFLLHGVAPKWHENIHSYDLSSAYPYAMSLMPGFTKREAYREVSFGPRRKDFPVPGIYKVSGKTLNKDYPPLYDHGFKIIKEEFENIWVTGYELNQAVRSGSVKLTGKVTGYIYDADDESALKHFVDDFYAMKNNAETLVERHRNKIILNSLYGKFIQTTEIIENVKGELVKIKKAGGLYQPFIASSICGHTRSVMHNLELELDAIHTATDGVFCYKKPNGNLGLPESGLGSLEHEGTGTLALARNKLYIFYGQEGKFDSPIFENKKVMKYARHGYQGTLKQLEQMIYTGKRRYSRERPNSVKESIKQGLSPNKFERHDYVLKIAPFTVYSGGKYVRTDKTNVSRAKKTANEKRERRK